MRGFFVSLAQAVLIVLAVLVNGLCGHGDRHRLQHRPDHPRHFVVMASLGIDLQAHVAGALIIALGMMVDNSIVVAEGALVRMQQAWTG